jgi:hypothetical protein
LFIHFRRSFEELNQVQLDLAASLLAYLEPLRPPLDFELGIYDPAPRSMPA